MLTHQELVSKKIELEDRLNYLIEQSKIKQSLRDTLSKQISNISKEENDALSRAKEEALNEKIKESTFKIENLIHKLNKSRQEILDNRERRLSKITYELYSKKVEDKLSVDEYVDKCESIEANLIAKYGPRLSGQIIKCIPTDEGSYGTLEDIMRDFDEIDNLVGKLTDDRDLLARLEKFIFKYDTETLDKNSSYIFIVVVLLIGSILVAAGPVIILLLVSIICYNIYKGFSFYRIMTLVKNIKPNIGKIKESIDNGIRNRMNSDKVKIEGKFKSKLDEVDKKVEQLEERIADITEAVRGDFSFDGTRVSESYKIKERSLKDRVQVINREYEELNVSIGKVKMEIEEVSSQIVQLGKSIYFQYYPRTLKGLEKSAFYPNDILLDVINNTPNLFKLPRGSCLYVYDNDNDALSFLNLYFLTIFLKMQATAFTVYLLDLIYVGTKFLKFSSVDNFETDTNEEDIKSRLSSMRSEMLKRVSIIGNSSLDEYNRQMIEEDSATLTNKIIVDFMSTCKSSNDESKQIIKNGYRYGIIYSMFISKKELLENNNFYKTMVPYFDSLYSVNSFEVVKRSKKYFDNLIEKQRSK